MPLTVLNNEIKNILKSLFEFSADLSPSQKLSYPLWKLLSLNIRLVKMQNMCRNKKIDTKNHPIAWSNVLRSAANSQFHALWNSKTIWYTYLYKNRHYKNPIVSSCHQTKAAESN